MWYYFVLKCFTFTFLLSANFGYCSDPGTISNGTQRHTSRSRRFLFRNHRHLHVRLWIWTKGGALHTMSIEIQTKWSCVERFLTECLGKISCKQNYNDEDAVCNVDLPMKSVSQLTARSSARWRTATPPLRQNYNKNNNNNHNKKHFKNVIKQWYVSINIDIDELELTVLLHSNPIQSTFVKRHQSSCLFRGASQKHRGKPLLLTITGTGFFYVHYTTHGTYSFTSYPKDEAIMVKCLAQGHKCRYRESNPHSGFLTTPELESGALDR